MYPCLSRVGFSYIFLHSNRILTNMNYRTEKNDRVRRRKARTLTAFITVCLLAGFAYAAGVLDDLPELFNNKPATEVVEGPVARA